MSYKLEKPYTDKERTDFIFRYNQDCFQEDYNCRIEETETALYALEDNELLIDDEVEIDPDYEERHAKEESERIGNLTMTALDFITFLRQCGLTLEQIKVYLDNNIELDTQLKYCQNVYCRVAKQVFAEPLTIGNVTITAEMVEQAFKFKNGETTI